MTIKNYSELVTSDLTSLGSSNFKITTARKSSDAIAFLTELYNYPPQFTVLWEQLDNLSQNSYRSDLSNSNGFSLIGKKTYDFSEYVNGYINKLNSSRFYQETNDSFAKELQSIPIYTIVNGRGEIVFNTSNFPVKTSLVSDRISDLCGASSLHSNIFSKVGLLFLNHTDAEFYLKEIAKLDPDGTKKVSLSIHCISLKSSYELMREYANIDFRFVPNLDQMSELVNIIKTGDSRFVFDSEQQQYRSHSIKQYLQSFKGAANTNQYFKGVPIYIIQVRASSQNFVTSNLLNNFTYLTESIRLPVTNWLNLGRSVSQKSLLNPKTLGVNALSNSETYVCFDKLQAISLTKKFGHRIITQSNSKNLLSSVSTLFSRSKIYVSNLEDFLELYDESKLSGELKYKGNTYFIPSNESIEFLENVDNQSSSSLFRLTSQFLLVKYRILKGFIGVLISNN